MCYEPKSTPRRADTSIPYAIRSDSSFDRLEKHALPSPVPIVSTPQWEHLRIRGISDRP